MTGITESPVTRQMPEQFLVMDEASQFNPLPSINRTNSQFCRCVCGNLAEMDGGHLAVILIQCNNLKQLDSELPALANK